MCVVGGNCEGVGVGCGIENCGVGVDLCVSGGVVGLLGECICWSDGEMGGVIGCGVVCVGD